MSLVVAANAAMSVLLSLVSCQHSGSLDFLRFLGKGFMSRFEVRAVTSSMETFTLGCFPHG